MFEIRRSPNMDYYETHDITGKRYPWAKKLTAEECGEISLWDWRKWAQWLGIIKRGNDA